MIYKQILDNLSNKIAIIQRLSDTAFIPLAKANTDYQQFKKDLSNGAELQDSTGAVMTASQIQAFIATLP